MRKVRLACAFIIAANCNIASSDAVNASSHKRSEVMLAIETNMGIIQVELYPKAAPRTVANFINYVKDGFYSNTIIHRVVPGVLIQGGGYDEMLQIKPTRDPIKSESDNKLKNIRGTIAMARARGADTATSQFFINLKDNISLNWRGKTLPGYTVFGKVIGGIEVLETISRLGSQKNGAFLHFPKKLLRIKAIRTTARKTAKDS